MVTPLCCALLWFCCMKMIVHAKPMTAQIKPRIRSPRVISFLVSMIHAGWMNARKMGPSQMMAPSVVLSDIVFAMSNKFCLIINTLIQGRKKETNASVTEMATTMRPTPKPATWTGTLELLLSFDIKFSPKGLRVKVIGAALVRGRFGCVGFGVVFGFALCFGFSQLFGIPP